MEGFQQIHKLGIAPSRYRQDELQWAATRQPDRLQLRQVVGGQQAAIGHGDDPLDRKAPEHLLEHRLEGRHLGSVAIEHLVIQRDALGGLHHAHRNCRAINPSLAMPKWRTSPGCSDRPSLRIVVRL